MVILLVAAGPCLGQSILEKIQRSGFFFLNLFFLLHKLSSGLERLGHEGRKDMGRLGDWFQPHIDRLGAGVGPVLDRVGQGVGQVGDTVGPALESLGDQVARVGEQVGPALSNLGEQVKPAIDSLGQQVAPVIHGVGEHVGGMVDGLVDTVKESPMFREQLDRSDDMIILRGEGELSAPPAGGPGLLGAIGDLAGQLGSHIGRLNPLGGREAGRWWQGAGVCTERQVERQEERTERVNVNSRGFGVLTMNMEESVCEEVGSRYECRTGIEEGGVKKTIIVRYGCCHGYQREDDHSQCSQVSMKSLEETVREQGGLEFLALVEEAAGMATLRQNMTVFVPSNSAVEQFHRELMEFNTLEPGTGVSSILSSTNHPCYRLSTMWTRA